MWRRIPRHGHRVEGTVVVAARVRLREISNEEGNRLLRIVRRTSGSVVTWRRAQIVLLSAQGMTPPGISEVVFTDPDTVREVIHNFNRDGFDALYPRYAGRPAADVHAAQAPGDQADRAHGPADLDQPFATWSLAKLADYLVAEGVVTDISHEGLRAAAARGRRPLSSGEDLEALQRPGLRGQEATASSSSTSSPTAGEAVVICLDEFGPLNLQPQPGGKGWAPRAKPTPDPRDLHPPARRPPLDRAPTTSPPTASTDTSRSARAASSSSPSAATSARLYPPERPAALRPRQLQPAPGEKVRDWAEANNVELAYTPYYGSWLNRIEAQLPGPQGRHRPDRPAGLKGAPAPMA